MYRHTYRWTLWMALVSLVGVLAPGAALRADLTVPISQTRTVSATAHAEDDAGSETAAATDSAADFGPYTYSTPTVQALTADVFASASGHQNSDIVDGILSASGFASSGIVGYDDDALASTTASLTSSTGAVSRIT